MTQTLTTQAKSLINGDIFRFAHCVKFTPRNLGVNQNNIFLTDHNQQIVFDPSVAEGTQIWYPDSSLQLTAIKMVSGIREGDLEILGAFETNRIEYDAIVARIWDGGTIDLYLVDWRYPFVGPLSYHRYYVKQSSYTDERWNLQLAGMSTRLTMRSKRDYSRVCRHRLGDAQCGVSLTTGDSYDGLSGVHVAKIENASVSYIGLSAGKPVFFSGGMASTENAWWRYGFVEWLTGNNTGYIQEVQVYLDITKQITLSVPTPETVVVGDTFNITVGCNKLWADVQGCKVKFDNGDNFGGFPYIPEPDTVLRNAFSFRKNPASTA